MECRTIKKSTLVGQKGMLNTKVKLYTHIPSTRFSGKIEADIHLKWLFLHFL
jgi:hypothetical protein